MQWEQSMIDNAVEYSIVEWLDLIDKSTKTIVKTYEEAKEGYMQKTSKETYC